MQIAVDFLGVYPEESHRYPIFDHYEKNYTKLTCVDFQDFKQQVGGIKGEGNILSMRYVYTQPKILRRGGLLPFDEISLQQLQSTQEPFIVIVEYRKAPDSPIHPPIRTSWLTLWITFKMLGPDGTAHYSRQEVSFNSFATLETGLNQMLKPGTRIKRIYTEIPFKKRRKPIDLNVDTFPNLNPLHEIYAEIERKPDPPPEKSEAHPKKSEAPPPSPEELVSILQDIHRRLNDLERLLR